MMECRDSSARCAFDALVKSVAATVFAHAQCECASNFSFSHIILSFAVQRNVQRAYNLVFRFKLCVKSRTGANVHMTFEAAKCEVYTVHTETKRDNKTKSNKKYVWTAKFEQTVLFYSGVCEFVCIAITIMPWFEASQQQTHSQFPFDNHKDTHTTTTQRKMKQK